MTILTTSPTSPPRLLRGGALRLAGAGPALWRVLDATGRVIGHLQTIGDAQSVRYRARRFHVESRSFRELGDFWSPDDAIDCLRFAR